MTPGDGLQVHTDLAAVADLWQGLSGSLPHPFATWEFHELWWRHYGSDRPLRLVVSRTPDGRQALLPLYHARLGPVRVLRFLGHTVGDLPGPVAAEDGGPAVLHALRALPDRIGPGGTRLGDLLLAEQLAVRPGWAALLRGHELTREPAPVLRVDGRTWEQLLAGWSANLRQQVRRRERSLRREHNVELRLTTDPERLPEDMDVLLRLHARRWGHAGAFKGGRADFHRAFAALALQRGWLRLWRLDVDGVPAAAWYGFRYAGQEWFYQSGRDPAFDRLRVGFVLTAHTVRDAVEGGVDAYQFLRGGEEYKLRFADDSVDLLTFLVGLSPAGRAVARASAGLARLPSSLQEPVRRVLRR